ncbi:MAG: cytochrome c3 family protein, partial [Acidobacteriota bacterium]
MKMKALIVIGFMIAYSASAATQGQKLPGDDLVIPSVDEKWGAITFTHQKHLAYSDCTYCHHTNKGLTLETLNAGKSEKIPMCAECHTRAEGNAKTPKS